MKLAALRVAVRDIVAARGFYRDGLGLRLHGEGAAEGDQCSISTVWTG